MENNQPHQQQQQQEQDMDVHKEPTNDVVYVQVVDQQQQINGPTANQTTTAPPIMAPGVDAPAMAAPAAAPGSSIPPQHAISVGAWGAGLWDCFDSCVPNCCMTWCCSCVTLAQVAHRIQWMNYSTALIVFGVLTLLSNGTYSSYRRTTTTHYYDNDYSYRTSHYEEDTSYSTGAMVFGAVGSIAYVIKTLMVMSLRSAVRKQFQIPGDACGDCCCSCCCMCCVAAQMATHVKSYTPGDCSFTAPSQLSSDQLPSYQS